MPPNPQHFFLHQLTSSLGFAFLTIAYDYSRRSCRTLLPSSTTPKGERQATDRQTDRQTINYWTLPCLWDRRFWGLPFRPQMRSTYVHIFRVFWMWVWSHRIFSRSDQVSYHPRRVSASCLWLLWSHSVCILRYLLSKDPGRPSISGMIHSRWCRQ